MIVSYCLISFVIPFKNFSNISYKLILYFDFIIPTFEDHGGLNLLFVVPALSHCGFFFFLLIWLLRSYVFIFGDPTGLNWGFFYYSTRSLEELPSWDYFSFFSNILPYLGVSGSKGLFRTLINWHTDMSTFSLRAIPTSRLLATRTPILVSVLFTGDYWRFSFIYCKSHDTLKSYPLPESPCFGCVRGAL